jgi:hypothetical protein
MKKSQELKEQAQKLLALATKYEALEAEESGLNGSSAPKPAPGMMVVPVSPAAPKAAPMPSAKPARKTEPVPKRKIPVADLNERVLKALPVGQLVEAVAVAGAVGEHKFYVGKALKALADNGLVIKSGNRRGTKYQIVSA